MSHIYRKRFPILRWTALVFGAISVLALGYLLGHTAFLETGDDNRRLVSLVVAGASAVVALTSYSIWQRLCRVPENPRLNSLSTMLKTREQQSEILIHSIADGIIVFDTSGKINLLNPAAAAMTGWKVEDAYGIDVRTVMKLAQEDNKPLADPDIFSQVLDQKQSVSRTLRLTGHDNKQTVVSLVISPVVIEASTVVGAVAVFRDITKERQAEQQRADFISTASHEMRTPVAAIEGYLSLALNDKVSTIDNKAREYLVKAHESTEHLGKLFQDLLTSARAEDGRLSNHPVVVEVGGLVQQLVDGLRFTAEKKRLALEFVVGMPDVIDTTAGNTATGRVVTPLYYTYADPERLREVITNLFDNAVKYTDHGKISVGLTGNNDSVQLYVRDTGAGIPADDIQHLFQKFYRVDNSITRTVGGTGLGLFICRKIIELYGGRVWVDSTVGKGSTFYINLPRLTIQRAQQLKASESRKENSEPAGTLASS